ncbi:hypothetical protein DIU31_024145 [Mucilaginibacter rubeus]|uniref:Uncharacterized protein n=1 Tax=Mucilaginibacter rubeus TaxID=2027860 RepID=A0AAE6MKH7_9SPHI|nr:MULTISPECIES: hypothetical protein [Mucilaginibacter]QEM06454.1 hypothetical protein DIU31_024145 [Mucilaginibacter rubeus]QEM19040.1 hypothetical protein DIU38_024395 [Mucilaginibacter gossypii]QTE44419.1 hypothetical protein J3L19_03325 [Mucilaginibacter rubeus]QTE51018.1 hypothetical protein J3L21_03300 [Mucilaginibacter rubeus]QTE56101.1 hypothetical protein J3L23_28540 [Mucilaginibacter rubeus]
MLGYASKQLNTLLLLVVYLFVVITHIFFVPRHAHISAKTKSGYNSIFKRKIDDGFATKLALLKRTDKTVLNDKKNANSLILFYAGAFLMLFLGNLRFSKAPVLSWFNFLYFPAYRPFISSLRI